MSYKDTLNLPSTKFPMKANLANREPKQLEKWQSQKIYEKCRALRQGKEKYILHDGPPYANGKIHLGHAVNKVLKDIVVKSHGFSGYDTPYVPGWDCHGLPIELNVEKKVGKAGDKISAKDFRQACRDYASSQVEQQREAFIRLGVFGDWEHPYLTMNFSFEAGVLRALSKVMAHGHLQQGHKPVHWCLDCRSSLAEAEVEYYDKTSPSIDVSFYVKDKADFYQRFNIEKPRDDIDCIIPIWTTTPWTLPANRAVALHPELNYVLVETTLPQGKLHLLIAEALKESVLARYGADAHRVLATTQGKTLDTCECLHPFYDRVSPVIMGDHVTIDAGTGAVHTAPAHGREDYQVSKVYNLCLDNPVMGNGCYVDDLPLFGGQHILKANSLILSCLEESKKLLSHTKLTHSYPHCWRHKTPLIFRATPQWFISMEQANLRDKALAAIKQTNWLPATGESRITDMIEHHPGWCISRQRVWGVPMSLFIHKQTGELHPDMSALLLDIASRVEKGGVDVAFDLQPEDLLGDAGRDYEKIPDTLDVWFDSGVTHVCVLEAREALQVPADLYLEGSDQHRGWFQSSLLTSMAIRNAPPYKTVLTHGFTVDENGRKMSKSLGNIIEPQKVIQSLGADVLRLYIASTDFRYEMTVSQEIFNRTSDTYRRLRNTARFMLANLHDFEPEQHLLAYQDLLPLEQFALDITYRMQQEIIQAYDAYQFQHVTQKIHHFCSVIMGGFYLDIIKDRQYTMQANAPARRSAQTALYHMIQALACWLAPILSFTAEEIWSYIPGMETESIFLNTWYDTLQALPDDAVISRSDWEQLLSVRTEVNKALESARQRDMIGSSLAAKVQLYVDDEHLKVLNKFEGELHFLFISSDATVHPLHEAKESATLMSVHDGLKIDILVSDAKKCVRCWHHQVTVGQDARHPELCTRCISNVEGPGETRRYA